MAAFTELIVQTKLKQADDWVCAMIRKGLPQTFLPTRLAYLERLPTVAEQLIFPPIGWIDYKIGKLGDIGAATRDVLANVARWFWNIR